MALAPLSPQISIRDIEHDSLTVYWSEVTHRFHRENVESYDIFFALLEGEEKTFEESDIIAQIDVDEPRKYTITGLSTMTRYQIGVRSVGSSKVSPIKVGTAWTIPIKTLASLGITLIREPNKMGEDVLSFSGTVNQNYLGYVHDPKWAADDNPNIVPGKRIYPFYRGPQQSYSYIEIPSTIPPEEHCFLWVNLHTGDEYKGYRLYNMKYPTWYYIGIVLSSPVTLYKILQMVAAIEHVALNTRLYERAVDVTDVRLLSNNSTPFNFSDYYGYPIIKKPATDADFYIKAIDPKVFVVLVSGYITGVTEDIVISNPNYYDHAGDLHTPNNIEHSIPKIRIVDINQVPRFVINTRRGNLSDLSDLFVDAEIASIPTFKFSHGDSFLYAVDDDSIGSYDSTKLYNVIVHGEGTTNEYERKINYNRLQTLVDNQSIFIWSVEPLPTDTHILTYGDRDAQGETSDNDQNLTALHFRHFYNMAGDRMAAGGTYEGILESYQIMYGPASLQQTLGGYIHPIISIQPSPQRIIYHISRYLSSGVKTTFTVEGRKFDTDVNYDY